MTGRHEFKSGVTHTILERERMSLKATTLAQVLKSAGYTTGIFGKWHLGDEDAYQPERRGFDEVYHPRRRRDRPDLSGQLRRRAGQHVFQPAILHNGTFEKTQGYCTDLFFAQALKWMDAQAEGGRAVLRLHPAQRRRTARCSAPRSTTSATPGKVPENVAKFYGMIENIDDNFGTLLDSLRDWGLERDTLVIFLTDNGGTAACRIFNAGMRGSKGTAYQGGTRVPSFWRWPAGFSGGVGRRRR